MKYSFTIFFSIIVLKCFSNPYEAFYRKWYFGNQAGIDFSIVNNPVAVTTSASSTYDYCSAICDFNGNTLFYTNGETVWNQNNVVMTNGSNLNGSTSGGQTTMILRVHDEGYLYYIFTVSEFASANGFCYSIVDMSLQGGLGEVIEKNHLLFAPSTEKLSAVFNSSNNSYWIIAHQWGNNAFAVYKLNTLGLDTVPIISNVGHINMGGVYGSSHDACGEMSVSPDGNRIACAYNYSAIFELYDFDILTGIVSNPITISNVPHIWGIEFSPDSKKLYTTLWTQTEVAQYDISTNNAVAIAASKYVAGNVPYSGSYACGYLELAPNGVIYIAKWNGTDMSQINNPDSLGTACGFTNAGFNLGGGINQCGLSPSPVFPSSVGAGIESLSASNFQISPNPVRNEFTVTLTDEMIPSEKSHLSLYTVEGKFIKSIPVTSRETIVKRGKLTAGIYICELNLDGKILASQKILVE